MASKGLEEEDLSSLLMDGDDFVTEEERRKKAAEQRRLARKRRLQEKAHQADDDLLPPPKIKKEEVVGGGPESDTVPVKLEKEPEESQKDKNDDVDDGFDMFSSSVSPVVDTTATTTAAAASNKASSAAAATSKGTQQDWDDAEGYFKAVIGEIISVASNTGSTSASAGSVDAKKATTNGNHGDISFRVSGVIGKGVFSSVLKCTTISNSTSVLIPPVVAIKCIRHNETMAKTAYSEIQYLQKLHNAPGIVPLLLPTSGTTPIEHKGHVLLVFPCADYNLRDVLQKFGKGVGLSLEAVRSYFGQLLSAATHLKKHSIIHSDLKPDNILVSRDFSLVQLGDFGSAMDAQGQQGGQIQPTPYLVSRFYRAPEIILGLVPTYAIDLWSLAVSVAEIFLGDVVFVGKDNNSMILSFMQHIGPLSNRLIRQHLVQCQRLPIPPHFTQRREGSGADYLYTQHTTDPVTGKAVNKYISLVSTASSSTGSGSGNRSEVFPSTPLSKRLLKAKSAKDSRTMVLRFSDLLQKCLALDPSRRISLKDSLQHDFFTKAVPAAGSKTATSTSK